MHLQVCGGGEKGRNTRALLLAYCDSYCDADDNGDCDTDATTGAEAKDKATVDHPGIGTVA
jgi:hypothetical protein